MKQIEIAKKYVGQKEIPGNKGWKDPEYQKRLEAVGWSSGESWCVYAQEDIFKQAFPEKFNELDRLFSANAVKTFENLKSAGYEISPVPVPGALVIWQRMKDGKPDYIVGNWKKGHAGLVGENVIDNWIFDCYEGNSNAAGSRNGDTFTYKTRKHLKTVRNGLKILGFVIIK